MSSESPREVPAIEYSGWKHIFDAEFFSNPHVLYSRIRRISPVVRLGESKFYLVTGHAAAVALLRNPATISSVSPNSDHTNSEQLPGWLSMLQSDPPDHEAYRNVVNSAFSSTRISELEDWIRARMIGLTRNLVGDEPDVISTVCARLPSEVIARILGMPLTDQALLSEWSHNFFSEAPVESELRDLKNYIEKHLQRHRVNATGDLTTKIMQGRINGRPLDQWELFALVLLILIAGNETTIHLLGNILNILAAKPEIWRHLQRDRSLIPHLIQETLRYDSPVQIIERWPIVDVRIPPYVIPRGAYLWISLGAANRDPKAIDRPDEFDLRRKEKGVAFGSGIHACLGRHLAVMESRVMLEVLLGHFRDVEYGHTPGQRQCRSHHMRGFESLPLRFVPA